MRAIDVPKRLPMVTGVLRSSVFHCAVLCKVKGKNVLKNDHWTAGTNSAVLLDARDVAAGYFVGAVWLSTVVAADWYLRRFRARG
jgi:hypothetical protein